MPFLCLNFCWIISLPSVLWRCWLSGGKGIRLVKKQWWGGGVLICLKRGADLHLARLMPLPLTVSCYSEIQIGFWYRLTRVVPDKGSLNGVCVCISFLISTSGPIFMLPFIVTYWLLYCCIHSIVSNCDIWWYISGVGNTVNRGQKCADTIGTVPVPWLAVSSAEILIYFSNKIYRSNLIKQYSETVMAWNYQNADCSLRKKIIASFIIIFGALSIPISTLSSS